MASSTTNRTGEKRKSGLDNSSWLILVVGGGGLLNEQHSVELLLV